MKFFDILKVGLFKNPTEMTPSKNKFIKYLMSGPNLI